MFELMDNVREQLAKFKLSFSIREGLIAAYGVVFRLKLLRRHLQSWRRTSNQGEGTPSRSCSTGNPVGAIG